MLPLLFNENSAKLLFSKGRLIIFYGQGVLRHEKKSPDTEKKTGFTAFFIFPCDMNSFHFPIFLFIPPTLIDSQNTLTIFTRYAKILTQQPKKNYTVKIRCFIWDTFKTLYCNRKKHPYTQNKRRVVVALVSPISAHDSPWCYIGPIGSLTKYMHKNQR